MYAPLEILLVEDNEGDVEMTRHACSAMTSPSVASQWSMPTAWKRWISCTSGEVLRGRRRRASHPA